ncbi:unnamed protein product [Clonostachys rhizophaga]|uniref:Uncharacterized protein n=1 Tax=Clonostachys rhizophaga TaxID=160324 RepID=A0A9N9VE35_9HYPO|nr:unnamed protein product [Clonostachys rhizophaga]
MKSTGLQDPYIAVLPQLALSNANLRKAVLCFGASQYKALGRDDKYSSMVVKFSRESSFSFVREATSVMPDERDTLATIAAGVFLHYFSLDRRTPYLHLSTWLASKLLSRPTKSANIRQISNEEILTLLRWSVISSACSLGLSQTYLSLENFRMIQLLEEEVGLNLSGHSALFKDWVNHPLYAFSSRLVNPLLLMGKLIQQTMLMGTGQGMPEEHAAQYQQEVLEVEEGLSHARREDLRLLNSLNPTDPDPLICVNESMHAAASILLHSRLKGLPSTAPVIRSNVDIIVNQLSDIAGDSRALYAIWSQVFRGRPGEIELIIHIGLIV